MQKRNKKFKKRREDVNKGDKNEICNTKQEIDEDMLVSAIVKAYKIIQIEENEDRNKEVNNENVESEKWYIKILFMLNVLVFPWKISKKFEINNQICDGILVLFVSLILGLVGFVIWVIGMFLILYGVILVLQGLIEYKLIGLFSFGVLLIMFGSLFTLASQEFCKISDSNRIATYSASIIAVLGFIATIISMLI